MLKTLVIGHLGKDAIKKEVGGKTVINFNVAHSESYNDKDGNKVTKTTWVECAQWTEKTGILPYLLSGTQVYVEGVPEVGTYENKDGKTVATFKLRVGQIQLLGSKNKEEGASSNKPAESNTSSGPAAAAQEESDDLPF